MLYSKWICILYTIKPSKMHIYSNQTLPCDMLGYSVWLEEIVSVDTWGLCLPFSTGPDYARFWVTKTHRKWLTSGPRRLHATTSSFTISLSLKPSSLSCRLWVSWCFRVISIVYLVFLWCDCSLTSSSDCPVMFFLHFRKCVACFSIMLNFPSFFVLHDSSDSYLIHSLFNCSVARGKRYFILFFFSF